MNTVAINAKSIISKKGLKQKYVAQKMEVTERKLSDILNGRKMIDESVIKSLCISLDVTPNELFGYETT